MITLIEQTESVPVDDSSWTKVFQTDKFYNLRNNDPVDYDFSDDTIKQGVLINIGGANYKAVSDTAITGTTSEFVKVDSDGNASYVDELSEDVAWNSTYNYYTDSSGDAYLFDHAKAVYLGLINDPKTRIGRFSLLGYFKELMIKGTATIGGALTAASASIAGDLIVGGGILPSTSPIEDTTSTLSVTNGTVSELLPRGVYHAFFSSISMTTEGVGSLTIQQYFNGEWVNTGVGEAIQESGTDTSTTIQTLISSGTNLRVTLSFLSDSGSGYVTYSKT